MLSTLRTILHIIGSFALYYFAILPCKAALRCMHTGSIGWIFAGILWLSVPVAVFIWLPVTTFLNGDYELLLSEIAWVINYLLLRTDTHAV